MASEYRPTAAYPILTTHESRQMTPDGKPSKRIRLDADLRRKRILDEATVLVGRSGYHGFSVQELAERCQLTNAGLLYYFGSKEQLLIALLEDRMQRDAAAIHAAVGVQSGDFDHLELEDVRRFFHIAVAQSVNEPDMVRLFNVISSEALDPGHPAHDYFQAWESGALDNFTRMIAPHVSHPRSTARQLVALMGGLQMQWLRTNGGFDLVAEWDRAAATVLPSTPRARRARTRKS